MCFSSRKRNVLISKLNNILPDTLNRLIIILGGLNRLRLESSILPSEPKSERVNKLVQWTLTFEGCGLTVVEYTLNCILHNLDIDDAVLERYILIKRLNDLDEDQFKRILEDCRSRFSLFVEVINSNTIPRSVRVTRLMELIKNCDKEYLFRCLGYFVDCAFLNHEIMDEELERLGVASNSTMDQESARLGIELSELGEVRVPNAEGKWVVLPPVLPGTIREMSIEITTNRNYVWSWKRVHALTERLYPEYVKLSENMRTAQRAFEFGNSSMSRSLISSIKRQFEEEVSGACQSFRNELGELDLISSINLIQLLNLIPDCTFAIRQSLDFPPNSLEFRNGVHLVERLKDVIFHGLHIADKLLEVYFENLIAS